MINHVWMGEVEMGLHMREVHLGDAIRSYQKAAAAFAEETLKRADGGKAGERMRAAAEHAWRTLGEIEG